VAASHFKAYTTSPKKLLDIMKPQDHNKFIAIGFGAFAAIFGFTFLLLMLVSLGVFVGLGFTMAADTGDNTQVGIGIAGGVFSVIFYLVLGAIFVLPTALAGWKAFKRRPAARIWGTIAAIIVLGIMPLGTALGVYALWFFFGAQGKDFYTSR
jgi:hypothetical protein